jgi:tetratricopeptide (TPR) repeat protein
MDVHSYTIRTGVRGKTVNPQGMAKYMVSSLCTFIILYSFSPGIAAGEPPRPSMAAHRALYEAQQAMELNEKTKAAEILSTFIRENPKKNHYLLEFHLANVLALSGRSKEALIHYEKTLVLNPGYSAAWQNLGKTHLDLENYLKAGDAFLKGYETSETKDGSILYYAAVSYLIGKKAGKALPHLEFLTSGKAGDPRSEWLEALLKAYMDLKQEDKAFRLIHRLLEEQGDDPRWWKLLAQFHLQKGEYSYAAEALTIYSYFTALKEQEIVLLGDLYNVIGVPVKAAGYYEKAMSLCGKAVKKERLASAYIAAHKQDRAMEVLEEAISQEPDAKLCFMKGQLLYGQRSFDHAYQAFEKCTRLNPRDGRPHVMMGYCALQQDNIELARRAFQKASRFHKQKKDAERMLMQLAIWE